MSGSAVADAAGLGQVQHKAMVDNGYKPAISAAIVAAASTIGPVIPPSIPFVLFGALTGVSVARLFLAGFVPGVLMGLALMVVIALMAKPRGFPSSARARRCGSSGSASGAAFLPLLAPGHHHRRHHDRASSRPPRPPWWSASTRSSSGFLYKDLRFRRPAATSSGSRSSSRVGLLFIMAAANFFGWLTIYQRIPDSIIDDPHRR